MRILLASCALLGVAAGCLSGPAPASPTAVLGMAVQATVSACPISGGQGKLLGTKRLEQRTHCAWRRSARSATAPRLKTTPATWTARGETGQWRLYQGAPDQTDAEAILDEDVAWRRFTRGFDLRGAQERVCLKGDQALGRIILETVSITASKMSSIANRRDLCRAPGSERSGRFLAQRKPHLPLPPGKMPAHPTAGGLKSPIVP